ncbi:hypothetical protein JX265_009485 [Neoarthrinium moseri]|uniref:Uncharacterized protein n=1 Tax=Neoarthrinium moseri TaxID=1658444 RepID=A0A9P9WG71_9PEZI|nr:hypothetical protein JX265_009485 [Neoarthrinium moseri]
MHSQNEHQEEQLVTPPATLQYPAPESLGSSFVQGPVESDCVLESSSQTSSIEALSVQDNLRAEKLEFGEQHIDTVPPQRQTESCGPLLAGQAFEFSFTELLLVDDDSIASYNFLGQHGSPFTGTATHSDIRLHGQWG